MPAQDPRIRQLKIKTGIVKRLYKEKKMYEKEVVQQEEKIVKMQAEGQDEYNIKKMIEVKNESMAMIPDCGRRLKTSHDELTNLLETEKELEEAPEYVAAKEALSEVNVVEVA